MYKSSALLFCILITLSIGAIGQVRVTGHMSAEVVESVSAKNNLNSEIRFSANDTKAIDLGKITLNGSVNSLCDISVSQSIISNTQENYALDSKKDIISTSDQNSKTDISFSALLKDQLCYGDYNGRLTVIVSYN